MMNNNIIIFSLIFSVLLFGISFILVYNYKDYTAKKKNKSGLYGKKILETINPDNNSKALHEFVNFIDSNNPKCYTIKGNRYE